MAITRVQVNIPFDNFLTRCSNGLKNANLYQDNVNFMNRYFLKKINLKNSPNVQDEINNLNNIDNFLKIFATHYIKNDNKEKYQIITAIRDSLAHARKHLESQQPKHKSTHAQRPLQSQQPKHKLAHTRQQLQPQQPKYKLAHTQQPLQPQQPKHELAHARQHLQPQQPEDELAKLANEMADWVLNESENKINPALPLNEAKTAHQQPTHLTPVASPQTPLFYARPAMRQRLPAPNFFPPFMQAIPASFLPHGLAQVPRPTPPGNAIPFTPISPLPVNLHRKEEGSGLRNTGFFGHPARTPGLQISAPSNFFPQNGNRK